MPRTQIADQFESEQDEHVLDLSTVSAEFSTRCTERSTDQFGETTVVECSTDAATNAPLLWAVLLVAASAIFAL